jgi:hypothetical protein
MRLEQFDTANPAIKALKSNFNFDLDLTKLDKIKTREMLVKFHNVIKESKKKNAHNSQDNPTYLKAIMIAEALSVHYNNFKTAQIILENQEVEKAQTTLAAQDLVDEVQKMVENVNDMLVKQLPALTDSIQSEIGVNEGNAYNQSVGGALTQLNQTLSQTRTALVDALNQLTGMGAGDFGAPAAGGEEMAVTDVAAQAGPGGAEVAGAEVAAGDAVAPEEEPEAGGAVGRARR